MTDDKYALPQDPKWAKSTVGYRQGDNLRRCGKCMHFEPPKGCQTVASPISPDGYCVRWGLAPPLPIAAVNIDLQLGRGRR